jgi:hypothetical protein
MSGRNDRFGRGEVRLAHLEVNHAPAGHFQRFRALQQLDDPKG